MVVYICNPSLSGGIEASLGKKLVRTLTNNCVWWYTAVILGMREV
jgi:hypothetical protein